MVGIAGMVAVGWIASVAVLATSGGAPTVGDLLSRTYFRDVAISPDGTRVLAFLVDGSRSNELKLLDLDAGTVAHGVGIPRAPIESPRLPNDALGGVEWSREGVAAFVMRAPPIAEVWIAEPGVAARPALFPDQTGEVFDCFWRSAGASEELLVLRSEAGVGSREAVLRRVDLATHEVGVEIARFGVLTVREATLSPDGRTLAVVATERPTRAPEGEPLDLFVVDLESGRTRCLTDGDSIVDRPTFSPDGHVVACAQRHAPTLLGAAKRDLVQFDLATGLRRNLMRERPFSLGDGVNGFQEAIHFLRDGTIALVTQDGLADHVLQVDPGSARRGATPAGFATDGLCSWQRLRVGASGRFVAIESSPTEPERVIVGDAHDWRALPLLAPNEALATLLAASAEAIAFRGAGGLAMEGLLLTPDSAPAPWPTIVLLHGGSDGRHTARFNDGYAHAFVAAGFAVFAPNLRGSAGYSLEFQRGNDGDFGGAELADLDAAVDLLIARGIADPTRIGLAGHSYGGFLVELALTRGTRYVAAVASAGVSDWAAFVDQSDLPALASIGLGPFATDAARYRERSPLTHAAAITTPLLLIHGERDRRVPMAQSRSLQRAVLAAGGVCELLSEPSQAHVFRDRTAIARSLERTLEWFGKHSSPTTSKGW